MYFEGAESSLLEVHAALRTISEKRTTCLNSKGLALDSHASQLPALYSKRMPSQSVDKDRRQKLV